MKNIFHRTALAALCLATLALPGCEKSQSPQDGAHKSAAAEKAGDRHDHDAAKPGGQGDEHRDGHGEEEQLKLGAEEIAAAGIKTEELAEQEISEQLVLTATIRPNQDRIAHVAPRVPGRIVKAAVNLGDAVRAGQTLAVLDSLEVGEAHSAWLQARTAQALAKADFERAEALHTDQIIARKDHLRSHAEYEKSKAALAAAADRLRMLGVSPSLSSDGKAVSAFPLTTPFAGTVIEKHAILGELAQPDKALYTVADLSKLWIEANLFEKDLGRVKAGADAVVTVAAYPDAVFEGRLTYIAAVVDKETRTVQARVEVANPDGRLKPEMFATAAVRTGGKGKGLLLPEEAVVLLQGQPTAFVEEHGGFEPRAVELGDKLRGRVVVKAGLAAGDKVVTAGTYALKARIMKSQLGEGHAH
ncbi:MAG: efflux RND transporter periplasmic adaptor subunit [Rhodocyclales bacterium]|jgi:cobalt-zinc-cadmium efflux system membrane fusion protein|nr:efflux RND transporter periplasmic adaptor subunit [Rhodocyclales bacterium]